MGSVSGDSLRTHEAQACIQLLKSRTDVRERNRLHSHDRRTLQRHITDAGTSMSANRSARVGSWGSCATADATAGVRTLLPLDVKFFELATSARVATHPFGAATVPGHVFIHPSRRSDSSHTAMLNRAREWRKAYAQVSMAHACEGT